MLARVVTLAGVAAGVPPALAMAAAGTTRRAAARTAHRALATTATPADADKPGTIADLFVNLGQEAPPLEPRFADLKQAIREQHGLTDAILSDAWRRLELSLAEETARIRALDEPCDAVPIVQFADVEKAGGFSEEQEEAIRRSGCAVIKGVVPRDVALGWKQAVRDYAAANPGTVGFPEDNPTVYELYWSKPQVEARQHENMYLVQTLLNALWLANGQLDAPTRPFDAHALAYCDRLRIRNPGDSKFALGPHMDGGGIERWEDPTYRQVYSNILSGDWESYDAFDPTHRVGMTMDLYKTPNACTVFRTFQGWMSLSDTGPGEGTLRVHPLLREATAFVMLRPFLADIEPAEFSGAVPRTAQEVNDVWHSVLTAMMVSVPRVAPGDCVFWHGDGIHAVEAKHGGAGDSSVFYIPSVPGCELNMRGIAAQRDHFLEGKTPPDFPQNHSEVDFAGRATVDDLTPVGRRMMGVDAWLGADAPGSGVDGRLLKAGGGVGDDVDVLRRCAELLE